MNLHRILAAWTARPAFWAFALGMLFALPLARGLLGGAAPAVPARLGVFPDFVGRDERGGAFSVASLRGRAALVNLVCTTCPAGAAPGLDAMRRLQHRARNLGDALALISLVTDAAPGGLPAVRGQRPVSVRWNLVEGAPPGVRALFPQGGELLLLDPSLQLRGRYRGPSAENDALRDAALVLAGR